MTSRRHLYLGLFFLAVIVVLGGYTLFLTEFSLFSRKTLLSVYFSNTSGLREGDPVHVAGMRWGKVEELAYDPRAELDERITVRLSLNEPIELHDDATIRIRDATVLGGKVLAIEPGSPSSPPWPEERALYGKAELNVLDSVGAAVQELRDPLVAAAADIRTLASDARTGNGVLHQLIYDTELASDISATADNARRISQDVVDGKGTLGKLATDEALYNDLRAFLDDGQALLTQAREGPGLIAKLLGDETMAEDGRRFVENVRALSDGLRNGEGTLGRLFTDSSIADNLQTITDRIANGEGTLAKLLTDPEIYEDFKRVGDNLVVSTDNLREGTGTIGKLINDDEIYVEIRRAVRQATGALEEAREAAPISTFLNTVFLGF